MCRHAFQVRIEQQLFFYNHPQKLKDIDQRNQPLEANYVKDERTTALTRSGKLVERDKTTTAAFIFHPAGSTAPYAYMALPGWMNGTGKTPSDHRGAQTIFHPPRLSVPLKSLLLRIPSACCAILPQTTQQLKQKMTSRHFACI